MIKEKQKKKLIILIVFLILLITLTIFLWRNYTYKIKGLKVVKKPILSEVKEVSLGTYIPWKNYDDYNSYILSNTSDYNILKALGIEVKYPKILNPFFINKDEVILINEEHSISAVIQSKDKNFFNDFKRDRDSKLYSNLKDWTFKNWTFEYKTYKDAVVAISTPPDKTHKIYTIFLLDKDKTFVISLLSKDPLKNGDEIAKNMATSFKISS